MTILVALAWLLFTVGAFSAFAFLALYVWRTKPWRRRDGEPADVRRVRRDVLMWSGTVALLYLSSVIALATRQTHPSTNGWMLTVSGLAATLTTHRLVVNTWLWRAEK